MNMPLLTRESPGGPVTGFLADGVVVHRVHLAATSRRAQEAEARALAADLAATPADDTHIALGPVGPDGEAWLAIADPAVIEDALAATTPPPERLVPAALALPAPAPGATSAARFGELILLRDDTCAATLEQGLADGFAPATAPELDSLPLADPGLDLLQGRFAPKLPFWKARGFRPAAAILTTLAILFALVPPVAGRIRSAAAARLADEATMAIAARVTGQPFTEAEAAAAAITRLAATRGIAEVTPRLAALMAALEPEQTVRVARLAWAADKVLVATLAGDAAAINRVAESLATGPFAATQQGDVLRLAAPRAAAAAGASPAETRLAETRRLAEALAGRPAPAFGPAHARLTRLLAEAGLPDPAVETTAAGTARVELPAMRAAILLPLLARLEADGLAIAQLDLRRNADPSLRVELEVK